MAQQAQETRDFNVDRRILETVMRAQAGTLAKALLEGVMNSVDAGATKVLVTLTCTHFTIRDDGRGFKSRDEVLNWFETFGTPHEEGDATFGRFRIGRGQLMSFAKTLWRTGKFTMSTDLDGAGLSYGLTTHGYAAKGCSVRGTLYKELTKEQMGATLQEFVELIEYAPIPVRLNDKLVSKSVKTEKWDVESADAYIKTSRTGELRVYNQGVMVRKFDNYHFGTGGLVVSKQPLQLNSARNDILTYACDVWRRISTELKTANVTTALARSSLTDEERKFLAKQITYGNLKEVDHSHLRKLKLLTDVTGRHHPISALLAVRNLSVVADNQRKVGAAVHRSGKAFVLSRETLERFRVDSIPELLEYLGDHVGMKFEGTSTDFAPLALACPERYVYLEREQLTVPEQIAFAALSDIHQEFYDWFAKSEDSSGIRVLTVGESPVADAWTDGVTRVTLHRNQLLTMLKRGEAGCYAVLATLTHEYCHDVADLESHDHDMVFFQKHHDLIQYRGVQLHRIAAKLHKVLQRMSPSVPRPKSRKRAVAQASAVTRSSSPVQLSPAKLRQIDYLARQGNLSF